MFATLRQWRLRMRREHTVEVSVFVMVSVLSIVLLLRSSVFSQSSRITIFDVGEGQSVLIETVHHQTILIDGGSSEAIVSRLGSVLGPFRRTVDVVVITSPLPENLTGLVSVLRRYRVGTIVDNHWRYLSAPYQRHLDAVASYPDTTVISLMQGQQINIDGATLTALWPTVATMASPMPHEGPDGSGGVKDQSLVLRLELGDKSMLMMSGASTAVEQVLLRDNTVTSADVLLVGDHGSRFSTSPEFLNVIDPSIAVISVGTKNSYNHPAQSVVARLRERKAVVYQTSNDGTIQLVFRSDGIQAKTKQ